MARRPESGRTPRQAPDAASSGSGIDRQAKTPGIALPADLGRSLRLLSDAQLDRLAEASTQCAGQANGGGPVAKAHSGESGGSKAG